MLRMFTRSYTWIGGCYFQFCPVATFHCATLHFSYCNIVTETTEKLLTGHLKLQTNSIMTFSVINFWSVDINFCKTFLLLRNAIVKFVTSVHILVYKLSRYSSSRNSIVYIQWAAWKKAGKKFGHLHKVSSSHQKRTGDTFVFTIELYYKSLIKRLFYLVETILNC